MAGYDDSRVISDVTRVMARNPDISRRQAIMQVAGEGSLRRIEMKMARVEAGGGKGTLVRAAVAREHAADHPMTFEGGAGRCLLRYMGPGAGSTGAVGFVPAPDHGGVRFVAVRGATEPDASQTNPLRGGHWPMPEDGRRERDVLRNLRDLGLLRVAVSGVLRDGVNLVAAELGRALAARWEAHGFPASEHAGEAVAHETERMEASGLSRLRDAFGADCLHLLATLTDVGFDFDTPVAAIARLYAEPGRMSAFAAAGGMLDVVRDMQASDVPGAMRETVLRHPAGSRAPTEDEVSSLVDAFSDRDLSPMGRGALRRLVDEVADLRFDRLDGAASKASLLAYLADVAPMAAPLRIVHRFDDRGAPYRETLAPFAGLSPSDVRMRVTELVGLVDAVGHALVSGRHASPGRFHPVLPGDKAAAWRALASGLTFGEGLDMGMRWRGAGRPGQARAWHESDCGAEDAVAAAAALRAFLEGQGRPLPVAAVEPAFDPPVVWTGPEPEGAFGWLDLEESLLDPGGTPSDALAATPDDEATRGPAEPPPSDVFPSEYPEPVPPPVRDVSRRPWQALPYLVVCAASACAGILATLALAPR